MHDLKLSIDTNPKTSDVDALRRGLTEHALPITQSEGFAPLAVFAHDAKGALAGGVHGQVNWTWLHIALLWVSSDCRHQGLGSRLLRTIEATALERGCVASHLDTFSYQARPFYERQGYSLFATLEEYPPGHQRFFLRKALPDGAAG